MYSRSRYRREITMPRHMWILITWATATGSVLAGESGHTFNGLGRWLGWGWSSGYHQTDGCPAGVCQAWPAGGVSHNSWPGPAMPAGPFPPSPEIRNPTAPVPAAPAPLPAPRLPAIPKGSGGSSLLPSRQAEPTPAPSVEELEKKGSSRFGRESAPWAQRYPLPSPR
jgi:hypothetical protein